MIMEYCPGGDLQQVLLLGLPRGDVLMGSEWNCCVTEMMMGLDFFGIPKNGCRIRARLLGQ
jgi:hypothetical protein